MERVCEKCGAKLTDEAAICAVCGYDTRSGDQIWPTIPPQRKIVPPPVPAAADDDRTIALAPGDSPRAYPEPVTGLDAELPDAQSAYQAFVRQCTNAWRFATTNFGAIGRLVFFWLILSIILQIALQVLGPLMCFGYVGLALLLTATTVGMLILSGYTLQFYFNTVIGSLEGLDEAPDCPPWDFRGLLTTGAWGVGLFVVYVVPVVTLPLLPLGLLAYVHCDDGRCLDVAWALRAARRRPKYFVTLWAYLLLWGGVALVTLVVGWAVLSVVVAGLMALQVCVGYLGAVLLSLVGFGVMMTVAVAFVCMQFRCIGMLGAFCPDVLESVPARTNVARTGGFLAGGVTVGILLLVLAGWYAARSVQAVGEGSGQDSVVVDREAVAGNQALSIVRLHMCFQSASVYAGKHGGKFPPDMRTVAKGHPREIVRSPGCKDTFIVYILGLTLENDLREILFYDPISYGGRYNAIPINGDLVRLTADELTDRLVNQGAQPMLE